MHRDVKPHNVMIDHERRKVGSYSSHVTKISYPSISYASLTGASLSFTIQELSIMYE